MNLKIRSGTVGYDNKILVSDEKFSLGKKANVNLMAPVMKSHAQTADSNEVLLLRLAHAPTITHGVTKRLRARRAHKNQEPKTITHDDEKIVLVLFLASGFAI